MVGHDEDPLDAVLRPPANETPAERTERVRKEAEAKRISDAIDEDIRKEKAEKKKTGQPVRVLLLGQSESGKSTTLKNFRMRYDRANWDAELSSWRTVIQLNLVRSTLTILDAVQAEMDDPTSSSSNDKVLVDEVGKENDDEDGDSQMQEPSYYDANLATPSSSPVVSSIPLGGSPLVGSFTSNSASSSSPILPNTPSFHRSQGSRSRSGSVLGKSSSSNLRKDALQHQAVLTSQHHQLLKLRLAPLRTVEKDLKKSLGAEAEDEVVDVAMSEEYGAMGRKGSPDSAMVAAGDEGKENGVLVGGTAKGSTRRPKRSKEFTVRRLKDALNSGRRSQDNSAPSSPDKMSPAEEATELIANCREDMKALWMDDVVRKVLKKRRVRLEDSAGFFLDEIDRIATRNYVPSDDDVIRARLRTLGVQEYQIKVEPSSAGPMRPGTAKSNSSNLGELAHSAIGKPIGNEWLLYDVGGSRTIRHAWLPYFENVNAIIFLAPLSCFDERLVEDSRINRLEDSFLLWRTVCSSKLLEKTSLILFMNKVDLLKKKIKAGVKVKGYLPSYGDRANDVPTVVKYLKDKFRDIVKTHAPESGRVAFYYATSVIDTKSTGTTLKAVKDIIFREHLKTTGVL